MSRLWMVKLWMMEIPMKEYIGDGVYVDVENGMLKLTAEDGIAASDTIYIEASVWDNLLEYARTKAPWVPQQ